MLLSFKLHTLKPINICCIWCVVVFASSPSEAVCFSCVSSGTTAAGCRTGHRGARCPHRAPACFSSSPWQTQQAGVNVGNRSVRAEQTCPWYKFQYFSKILTTKFLKVKERQLDGLLSHHNLFNIACHFTCVLHSGSHFFVVSTSLIIPFKLTYDNILLCTAMQKQEPQWIEWWLKL